MGHDMTPETLRELLLDLTLSNHARVEISAAADAWEFTLDDTAGMVRQLEADREQLREYGEEIVSLRKRLEAAEKALPKSIQEALNSGDGGYRP